MKLTDVFCEADYVTRDFKIIDVPYLAYILQCSSICSFNYNSRLSEVVNISKLSDLIITDCFNIVVSTDNVNFIRKAIRQLILVNFLLNFSLFKDISCAFNIVLPFNKRCVSLLRTFLCRLVSKYDKICYNKFFCIISEFDYVVNFLEKMEGVIYD